jgi:putative endonuclease
MPAFAGMTGLQSVAGGDRIVWCRHSSESWNPGRVRMTKQPCVYLMASRRNGTLYIGVTSDLVKRVWEHKNGVIDGFTKRYGVHLLVWYEFHETMDTAIARESALKAWKREWKLRLIEEQNPAWDDLYADLL